MPPFEAPVGPAGGVNPAEIVHGRLFIGFTLKVLLQGIIYVQGYLYYTRFPKDRLLVRIVVGALILLDTLNIIFNTIYLYDTLITHFNDPSNLLKTDWEFASDPMLMGVTACIVQLFFAWRIKVLTENLLLAIPIVLFSIASCVGALGCGIGNFFVGGFAGFHKLKVFLLLWLPGSACADVLIVCALTWHLTKAKTGIARTDSLVDRILAVILPTGLLQATVAVVNVALCFGFPSPNPQSGTQFIFNFILSKLYTNSLLSSLNLRNPSGPPTEISSRNTGIYALRASGMPLSPSDIDKHISTLRFAPTTGSFNPSLSQAQGPVMIPIKITKNYQDDWN